jgi:hypothetical protein
MCGRVGNIDPKSKAGRPEEWPQLKHALQSSLWSWQMRCAKEEEQNPSDWSVGSVDRRPSHGGVALSCCHGRDRMTA